MSIEYREIRQTSDQDASSLLDGLLRTRYSCNPDFADLYELVAYWYVEHDANQVCCFLREVGFDHSGHPIVFGPIGRNDGLWMGISLGLGADSEESPSINKAKFEKAWQELERKYRDKIPPRIEEPRVPVTERSQILGSWSTMVLEGPMGSMSGERIVFLPDGSGFHEAYNVALMYYDEFRWKILENGGVSIKGVKHFREDHSSNVIEELSGFDYTHLAAECQTIHSGAGARVKLLYLPLRNEKWQWIAEAYGLESASVRKNYRPRF